MLRFTISRPIIKKAVSVGESTRLTRRCSVKKTFHIFSKNSHEKRYLSVFQVNCILKSCNRVHPVAKLVHPSSSYVRCINQFENNGMRYLSTTSGPKKNIQDDDLNDLNLDAEEDY